MEPCLTLHPCVPASPSAPGLGEAKGHSSGLCRGSQRKESLSIRGPHLHRGVISALAGSPSHSAVKVRRPFWGLESSSTHNSHQSSIMKLLPCCWDLKGSLHLPPAFPNTGASSQCWGSSHHSEFSTLFPPLQMKLGFPLVSTVHGEFISKNRTKALVKRRLNYGTLLEANWPRVSP